MPPTPATLPAFDLAAFLRSEQLPDSYADLIARLHVPLADQIAQAAGLAGSVPRRAA